MHISIKSQIHGIGLICTMLLEQIKGFYHGITKIFLLVGNYTVIPCLSGIFKDVYIVLHVRIDCGLDYITSKQHTKLYIQMVQGLANYAQKFTHYTSLAAPDPLLTL